MRGRRRSPGPPGFARRDDRRPPHTAPRDRRRRSFSPDRFRRGSSPPPFKRGRYGREPDDFYPPRGPDPGYYGRPSPPPRAPRSDQRSYSRRDGPRTYKDFCRTLPDDVTPEAAQKEYQQYLAEYWGSEVRADFESKKNEAWMRRRFDPRGMRDAMKSRDEGARKAAASFADELEAGLLDPAADGFNQGAGTTPGPDHADEGEDDAGAEERDDGGKGASTAAGEAAPDVMWKPERIRSDASLSLRLMKKLDQEKGIEGNPLDPAEKVAATAKEPKEEEPEPQSEPETGAEAVEEDAKPGAKSAEAAMDAEALTAAEDAKPQAAETAAQGNGVKEEGSPDSAAGRLDLQLAYLWRVHGVDYYAGRELSEPSQYELRLSGARVLRGPRPEEGEQAAEAEEKKALRQAEKRIDQVWKKRLISGDPFAAGLNQEKVEKLIEDWIEDQVKKIADNKWGCKLSQKLFVGRDYVLKHVRLKHTEKVEDQRSKILDDVFFDNYKRFREDEQKLMQAELAKVQQAMQMQQSGLPGPWEGGPPQGGHADPIAGGFAAPPFPMGGVPLRAAPMLPQRQMVMPGMMPGPGQMLVLAPGAGPMGPFISVPIADGMGGRGMGPMRGGPGRGRGGRGFFPGPPYGGGPPHAGPPDARGMREYHDLDNPSNNRSVLDYGDL